MQKIFFIFLLSVPVILFGQKANPDSNYIFWSKDTRLKPEDFLIKTGRSRTTSYGQFVFDSELKTVFGLPKNYKKKIRNYFVKNASSLDTTMDVNLSVRFQQTLFDLSEVYVRQFRKAVWENRKKVTWGKINMQDMIGQYMASFSVKRIQYDDETDGGVIEWKQKEWEEKIKKELEELKEFAAE